MIAIIDYRMGNLRSVVNAFLSLGHEVAVASQPEELREAAKIVLPGVGAFGDGMNNLHSAGWVEILEDEVRAKGKPFLGICLGMQLLATTGTEYGLHDGLNWVPGTVERLRPRDPSLRVPHIGWNDVCFCRQGGLYSGMSEGQAFYFVHSYALVPQDASVVSSTCNYDVNFAASLQVGNIYATQYHPEKSHRAGLAVLNNFAYL